MARTPKIWYRKDRRTWCVTIRGTRHNLGPNKKEATEKFHQLMGASERRPVKVMSLVAIADLYLEWVQIHRAKATYVAHRYHIERFCQKYPDLQLTELRPYHCQTWVDACPHLSQSTRRIYLRTVRRLVNWAIMQGYISSDPLKGLQMPAATRREVCLTWEEFSHMLGAIREDWLKQLVIVAFETGARPQEILAVEARHFDASNSRWVFPVPESKGKRQPRVVYLTPLALKITLSLAETYPTGRLFRNAAGKPLRKVTVASAFYRLRRRLGHVAMEAKGITRDEAVQQEMARRGDKRNLHELSATERRQVNHCAAAYFAPKICLYSMRHSFATIALQSGLDGLTVAILLGHKDPSMLARVYQHMAHNPQHLLGQVKKVLG